MIISQKNFINPNIKHNLTVTDNNNPLYKNDMKNKRNSPKSTIQKIIKKHKRKNKMIYMKQASRATMLPTMDPIRNKMDEFDLPRMNAPTTQTVLRKKPRKWNNKIVRNPQPFNRFHSKKIINGQGRLKREVEKGNLYVLQDLDEIQFLSNNSEYETFNAHVKDYW